MAVTVSFKSVNKSVNQQHDIVPWLGIQYRDRLKMDSCTPPQADETSPEMGHPRIREGTQSCGQGTRLGADDDSAALAVGVGFVHDVEGAAFAGGA